MQYFNNSINAQLIKAPSLFTGFTLAWIDSAGCLVRCYQLLLDTRASYNCVTPSSSISVACIYNYIRLNFWRKLGANLPGETFRINGELYSRNRTIVRSKYVHTINRCPAMLLMRLSSNGSRLYLSPLRPANFFGNEKGHVRARSQLRW